VRSSSGGRSGDGRGTVGGRSGCNPLQTGSGSRSHQRLAHVSAKSISLSTHSSLTTPIECCITTNYTFSYSFIKNTIVVDELTCLCIGTHADILMLVYCQNLERPPGQRRPHGWLEIGLADSWGFLLVVPLWMVLLVSGTLSALLGLLHGCTATLVHPGGALRASFARQPPSALCVPQGSLYSM
jgi:hypothetical protein